MRVERLAGALGALVHEIDLEQAGPAEHAELAQLLAQHGVLFFRDQRISVRAHRALGQYFGPLQQHGAYGTVEGTSDVTILESTPEAPTKIEAWHADMTFMRTPPLGSILHGQIIPEVGGDTLWSSMAAAWDALSPRLQAMLDGLQAEHSFAHGFRESLAEPGGPERLKPMLDAHPPVLHPVAAVHPVTGRRVLFVNALFTTRIIGLEPAESAAILDFLFMHLRREEFTCRFSWQPYSLAFWDNRATQHKPVNDYFPAHRRMHRVTIDGTAPVG